MFENILAWFKRLFGIMPKKTANESVEEKLSIQKYEDTTGINYTDIVANKLSNLICPEAVISISGTVEIVENECGEKKTVNTKNPRSEFLNETLQRVVNDLREITEEILGTGGVVLKPNTFNREIYIDVLRQDRFQVIEHHGKIITKAGFVADTILDDRGEVKYTRMEYHSLESDGTYIIENKVCNIQGDEISLKSIDKWANIEPIIKIAGVKKMLFAFIKCPKSNKRNPQSLSGVPITYGQDKLIKIINDIFDEIPSEYKNKKAFIGADETLFKDTEKNGKKTSQLPESGLYKLLKGVGNI